MYICIYTQNQKKQLSYCYCWVSVLADTQESMNLKQSLKMCSFLKESKVLLSTEDLELCYWIEEVGSILNNSSNLKIKVSAMVWMWHVPSKTHSEIGPQCNCWKVVWPVEGHWVIKRDWCHPWGTRLFLPEVSFCFCKTGLIPQQLLRTEATFHILLLLYMPACPSVFCPVRIQNKAIARYGYLTLGF